MVKVTFFWEGLIILVKSWSRIEKLQVNLSTENDIRSLFYSNWDDSFIASR